MEEKKSKKGIIWLIVILIVLVLGLVGFIVYDKVVLDDKDSVNEDSTTTTTTAIQNDKKDTLNEENVLRRDNFIYEINNVEHQISYIYKYIDSNKFYENDDEFDSDAEELAKQNNEYVYNMIYLEIFLNETKINNVEIPLYYDTEDISIEKLIDKVEILSGDTINIIKGIDKEYFVFTIEHSNLYIDGDIDPIIVNDRGKLIYTLEFQDGGSLWAEDENSIFYKKNDMYLIEDDKIYYLSLPDEHQNGDNIYVQENYIVVNNDKVEITKGSIYIGNGAGAY